MFPWGMSRHVRNDQPRNSGPQECGSVAPGSQSDHSSLRPLLVAFPATKRGCLICPISAFIRTQIWSVHFPACLCFWRSGAEQSWSPHRPLRPVWSLREASYFGRWLIEWDDEAGEALSPILSYGFGLCSPADFAVSVKRLLGHHQSRSS